MARMARRILFALCVVATMLIIVALLVKISIQQKAMASLSPKDQAWLEEWRTRKLNIATQEVQTTASERTDRPVAAERLKAAPFKAATVAAAKAFRDEWAAHQQEALDLAMYWGSRKTHRAMKDSAGLEEIRKRFATVESLIASFKSLLAQVDYEIDAEITGADPSKDRGIPIPDLLAIQKAAELLALQSFILAGEGNLPEAFEAAETIIRASKTTGYSRLVIQHYATAIFSMGVDALRECAERCDDPALLRNALEKQNRLAPGLEFAAKDVLPGATELIGIIREGQRRGIESNFQGMTGRQLYGEEVRVQEEYLRQIVLPSIHENGRRLEAMQDIEHFRDGCVVLGARPRTIRELGIKLQGLFLPMVDVAVYPEMAQEAYTRDDHARAKSDLLRLFMARRLFSLEHNREPEAISELAPDYLPETLADRFAEDGRPYSETPFFYSVGPDRIDQHGELRYDPTNGTMSAGDVFLER